MGLAGVKSERNEATMKQLNLARGIIEYPLITTLFITMSAMIQDFNEFCIINKQIIEM
jgi:hypothetical protein